MKTTAKKGLTPLPYNFPFKRDCTPAEKREANLAFQEIYATDDQQPLDPQESRIIRISFVLGYLLKAQR